MFIIYKVVHTKKSDFRKIMVVWSHVTEFACGVEDLINKLKQHLIRSMLEWLTAWEDRVPLVLMPRLMTVEVDVIIERKKIMLVYPI